MGRDRVCLTRRDTGQLNSLHDHSYDYNLLHASLLVLLTRCDIIKLLKRALNNRKRSDKAANTNFGISRKNNIKNYTLQ